MSHPPNRCFIDGRSLRVSAALLSGVMTFAPVLSFAQTVPPGVTRIVPDGRTATTVTTTGSVSTVTTATVSGPNAFNSFSQFQIGAGNTGNLILPNGTSNLINLVNGGPTVINGVLNAYKNGQIGGNVYFADPYGFVVGRSGVVNVGSLNVSTPTREFMDSVISPSGQINQGAVNNLLAGTVPISPDGNIRIRGRVNAVDAVRLTGQNVFVGPRDQATLQHAARFASTVNSSGLRSANSIVVRNGSIQIVAANNAKINSRMTARKSGGQGGDIVVLAGNAIRIGGAASLNVRGKHGDAGNIVIKAGTNLTVSSGARFDASSAVGSAGIVELSSFGTFNLAQGFRVNLGGADGKNGKLLIDPTDVVIGDSVQDAGVTMTNADIASSISAITGSGTWSLSGDSITVAAHGVIDGRKLGSNGKSNADSVNIELDAPVIKVFGQILATAENAASSTYKDGNITLNASSTSNQFLGQAQADTTIEINSGALLKGANIALTANSEAISSFFDSAAGISAFIIQSVFANNIGVVGGYVAGTANATITVKGGATLDASGDVTIAAKGREKALDPAVTASPLGLTSPPVAVAIVVGQVTGNVSSTVESNATIKAGGSLTVKAENDAALDVSAVGISNSASTALTFAYGSASITTNSLVATGANISVGQNVYVGANNTNSFNVTALAYAMGADGKVGAAVAVSDINTAATATLGASIKNASSAPIAGSVIVEANSHMPSSSAGAINSTSASATVGTPALANLAIAAGVAASSSLDSYLTNKMRDTKKADAKDAGALSMAFSDQSATASISMTQGGTTAPSIQANGAVAVIANVSDIGVSSLADASTNSQQVKDRTTQSAAQNSNALGVAIGQYSHHANAFIGQGVTVCCANVGVSATTSMPITITWLTYDNASTWLGKISGSLGVAGEVLTSYANATSEAQDVNRVGAANYFDVTNSATAWIAAGATITRNSATAPTTWSTTLADNSVLNWQQPIAVQASTYTTSIDIGGNFSWLGLTGTSGQQNGNGQSQAKSIGGAANVIAYQSDAIAGIGDGVTITSNGGVAVNAKNENLIVSVAPTSGAGSASSFNGIVAISLVDDVAHASISNTAKISAPTVSIAANEALSILSIGGAVGSAQNTAVGLVVAVNQIDADTAAYVGSNKADIIGSTDATDDPGTASTVRGYVNTDALNVQAQTYGIVTAATVAATEASSSQSSGSTFKYKILAFASKAWGALSGASDKASDSGQSAMTGTTPPKWSVDVSGSSSVNVVDANTTAYIAGASIDKYSGTNATSVQAVNNIILATGSGAGALDMAKNPATKSAAVAGAVSISVTGNATRAYIVNSTISHASALSVLGLAGGEQTTVGIGLAVNQSTNQNGASSVAGSVSVSVSTDLVAASVTNSTITADPSLSLTYNNGATVAAYQTTDIGIGGGALYKGGKSGFGFAITYAQISDPTGLKAVDAHVSGSSITGFYNATVSASDASRIGSGAGLAGYARNELGIALVINDISPTISAVVDNGSTITVAGTTQNYVVTTAYRLTTTDGNLTDTSDTDYTRVFSMPSYTEQGVTYYTYNVVHTDTTTLHGDVTVSSNGSRNAAFDAAIANASNVGAAAISTALVDFSGSALQAANGQQGASIIGVAGVLQGGQNSLGFSISANTIHQNNIAQITDATVTSRHGDVIVTADSSAEILGVAIGAAESSGQGKFAGLASTVINRISNGVSAMIGDDTATSANTSIDASNVVVRATDGSNIRGASGTLVLAFNGSSAGLAIVYDRIANSVVAGIDGAKVRASGDVTVSGASDAEILTVALGIAASRQVGLAGSVATSILNTNVSASITNGADVTASNNVAVLASNSDVIGVISGALGFSLSSAGVGISVVVSEITGATSAYISGATTQVDAYAAGANALSVNSGTRNVAFDVSTPDQPNLTPPDLSETQRSVHGLAVVATSHQAIDGVAVTLGIAVGGSAGALNPVASVMGGTTSAYIDSASIDTRDPANPSAGSLQNVFVGASSQTYARNLLVAGSASASTFAGAAAVAATQFDRTTHAYITDAKLGTTMRRIGDVAVNASATQVASEVGVGFAASNNAVAGTIIVNVFSADTQAYITHGALYAANLAVNATSENGQFAAAGAGAVSGSTGVAGGLVVGASENMTLAYIGDENGARTTVNLTGDLTVGATSHNTFYSYAIGGTGAGGVGVAGMLDFTVLGNTTKALVLNTSDTQTGSGSDVSVTAFEDVTVRSTTGAGAVGGSVGVGAGINVIVLKSQVASGIIDSTVSVPGTVTVTATGHKDLDMQTVTVGIGGTAGIAASIGLLIAGVAAPGDAVDQVGGTLAGLAADASNIGGDNGVSASEVPGNTNPPANRPGAYSLTNALGGANDAISAEITGGTTTANAVAVTAAGAVKTKNMATGVGLGGTAGVGAALGYSLVYDTVSASAIGHLIAPNVTVGASMGDNGGHAAEVDAYAGAGGLFAGVGAAIAIGTVNNTVTATLGGTVTGPDMTGATAASVSAADSSSIYTNAVGAAVAGPGAAIGISAAVSTKSSQIYAGITEGSTITGYKGITVTAAGTGSLGADSIAGAGGVFAGSGAGSTAADNEHVIAEIGTKALSDATGAPAASGTVNITVGTDGLTLLASDTPDTRSSAIGVAIAGIAAVGASVATATVNANVLAQVDTAAHITTAGTLSVQAQLLIPASGDSAHAFSAAGTGGLLVGANATVAEADNNATVTAMIADQVMLPMGDVVVKATSATSQSASTTGVSAGFVALGVSVALATADTTTTASIGSSVTSSTARTGGLLVSATGSDNNSTEAVSGAGGVVAGNGANATNTNNSTVLASIGDFSDITAGIIGITAHHTALYKASVNTVNASLAGASGATAETDIDSTVKVDIGHNVHLAALSNACSTSICAAAVEIVAQNDFKQTGSGDSATGAGGGVLNGAAVLSKTEITGNALIVLEDAIGVCTVNGCDLAGSAPAFRTVISTGTDPFTNPGGIRMTAFSTLNAADTVSLVTGGLITSAGVNSTVNATFNNTITVGEYAALSTYGSIGLGTFTQAAVNTGSYVSTYGLAAVGSARTNVLLTDNETVNINRKAALLAFGNINLTPGQDPGGNYHTILLSGSADAQAYVRGLIAIPVAYAQTSLTTNSTLLIDSGASVIAGQNVTLGADLGSQTPGASGVAHGYFLFLIPVETSDQDTPQVQTAKVTVNAGANVIAGYYHDQEVVIDCGALACGPNSAPTVRLLSGAPLTYVDNTAPGNLFDAAAYVNANYDPDVKDVLLTSIATQRVPTFQLGTLFASGGSVTINAKTIEGSGTVTANGSPKINVQANSPAYLLFNGAYIPDIAGGQVNFTGAADRSRVPNGMTINANGSSQEPTITIANNYIGTTGNTGLGPAMLFAGDVTNLGGTINITNVSGSYGSIANTNAQSVVLTVPNGAAVISNPAPGGYYGPTNAFGGFDGLGVVYPGGTPTGFLSTAGANIAAEYVANIVLGPANDVVRSLTDLTGNAYGGSLNDGTQHFGPLTSATLFLTNCVPGYSGGCSTTGGGAYLFGNRTSDGRYIIGVMDNGLAYTYAPISYHALNYTSNATLAQNSKPQTFGGGNVAIKAAIIDIDAQIVVGRPTAQSVVIPSSIESTLNNYHTQYQNAVNTGRSPNAIYEIPGLPSVLDAAKQGIGTAVYDAANNQIIVQDTNASSSGGRLIMEGAIISTSAFGNIQVNGGLGQVTITNNTSIPMVINSINTGNAAANGSVVSTVKITDTLRPTSSNTTTYLYTAGQGVLSYTTASGADPVLSGPNATQPNGALNASGTLQYRPVTGARLEWVQQAQLTRDPVGDGNWNWVTSADQPNNPWMFVSGAALSSPTYSATSYTTDVVSQAHPQGLVIVPGGAGYPANTSANLVQTITGGVTQQTTSQYRYSFVGLHSPAGGGFPVPTTCACNTGDADSTLHNFTIPTQMWLKLTTSVKADNPFNIAFNGASVGSINITSKAAVTLADQITNSSGKLSITATGNITESANAFVQTKSLVLDATGGLGAAAGSSAGAVGSTATPFAATLNGGTVSAQAGSPGLYMNLTGSSTVGRVAAADTRGYGNIGYTQKGDLLPATGADAVPINFIGSNIGLTSIGGTVGSMSAPIVLSANSTTNPTTQIISGGVVDISAQGDIAIVQKSVTPNQRLDLRLGTLASLLGDVSVTVNNGALVDARGQTASEALNVAQIDAVSALLHLTAGDNAAQAAIDRSVKPFEALVTNDYGRYFRFKSDACTTGCSTFVVPASAIVLYRPLAAAALQNASLTDTDVANYIAGIHQANGTLNLSDAALTLYRPLAKVALNLTAVTDDQVRAYADAQYQGIVRDFQRAYGLNWASLSQFASRRANFVYTVNDADAAPGLTATLTARAVWDPAQLVASIDQTAFQPVSPTVGNGTPNIVGRNVTLNVGGRVGLLAAPISIALNSLIDGGNGAALTTEQKAAIAAANTPGAVTTVGVDSHGATVKGFSISSIPTGVTVTGVEIVQQAPIFVSASGTFNANAAATAFVQSTGSSNLSVGQIVATGDVSLTSSKGLLAAANNGTALFAQQVLTNGSLTLTAGSGDIGGTGLAFRYKADGNLVAAQASGDVYLTSDGRASSSGGDMIVGRVFAGGTASLASATGGIQGYLAGLAITGHDVVLVASAGDLGAPTNLLQVQTNGGQFTGTAAAGSAYLYSPNVSGQAPVAFTIASLSTRGALSITTDFDLVAQSLTSASGDITTGSGAGAKVFSALTSAQGGSGAITVTAVNDLEIGSLTAPGLVKAQSGTALILDAGGALTSSQNKVSVIAGAALTMQSNTLFSAGTDLSITTTGDATMTRLVAGRDVNVSSGGAASIADASTPAGTMTIVTANDFQAGTLASYGLLKTQIGGALTLGAGGSLTSSHGALNINAAAATMQSNSLLSAAAGLTVGTTGDAILTTLLAGTDIGLTAGGNAKIAGATATTGSMTAAIGNAFEAATLAAPGPINVQIGGAFTLDTGGSVTSSNDLIGITAHALAMQAGSGLTAAKTITVATVQDAVLGKLLSQLAPATPNATTVSVTADRILGNGDGQTNVTGARPNSAVVFTAANGIGTDARPITIDVPFLSATTTGGDIHVASLGDFRVKTVSAPGVIDVTGTGTIGFDQVKGDSLVFKSAGALDVQNVEVTSSISFIATEITGTVVQTPGATGPLSVSITGPNGTPVKNAVLIIDPPVTIIPQLNVVDATITNIGPSFTILNGSVSGQLTLNMPGWTYVMNNRSPAPLGWPAVQLYQNGGPFYFSQNNNYTYTSGFVVDYGTAANVTALSRFNGMSFVRDIPRDMWNGSPFEDDFNNGPSKKSGFGDIGISPAAILEAYQIPKSVEVIGDGPAVNLNGLK